MIDMDMSQGHHAGGDFDSVPAGEVGASKEIPYVAAPPEFNKTGLPYGAWCRCSKCGCVGRSTVIFDFYADEPGAPLKCERCA